MPASRTEEIGDEGVVRVPVPKASPPDAADGVVAALAGSVDEEIGDDDEEPGEEDRDRNPEQASEPEDLAEFGRHSVDRHPAGQEEGNAEADGRHAEGHDERRHA
jgi:hypothetical protein